MRTIIAGTRNASQKEAFLAFINTKVPWLITEVVSGHARGPDRWGEEWAHQNFVPITIFEAKWELHPAKTAGYIRNVEMARYADALVVCWDSISKGTGHMIDTARKYGISDIAYFLY